MTKGERYRDDRPAPRYPIIPDAHPGGVSAGQRPAGGPAGDPTPATVVYGHVYGPVRGALGPGLRPAAGGPRVTRGPAAPPAGAARRSAPPRPPL